MLRLVSDENFNGRILRALQRSIQDLDVIRFQDTPLSGAEDPDLLEWAAQQGRIVLTHDVTTLVGFAYGRVRESRPMPGVIAALTNHPIGQVIDDLLILLLASKPEDIENRVVSSLSEARAMTSGVFEIPSQLLSGLAERISAVVTEADQEKRFGMPASRAAAPDESFPNS